MVILTVVGIIWMCIGANVEIFGKLIEKPVVEALGKYIFRNGTITLAVSGLLVLISRS